MRELLGGKGANLAEMTKPGMLFPRASPSPRGCTQYYETAKKINDDIQAEIYKNMEEWEDLRQEVRLCGQPLLVSVRSGARASIARHMDTILTTWASNDQCGVLRQADPQPPFRLRFYSPVHPDVTPTCHGGGQGYFEKLRRDEGESAASKLDTELTAEDLKELADGL